MTAPPDRCAHCLIPRDQHTAQRYAALPGWHDWAREPSPLERYGHRGWTVPAPTLGEPIAVHFP